MVWADLSELSVVVDQGWRRLRRVLSSVTVGSHDVRVRNFPGRRRTFAADEVERFDWQHQELREVGVLRLANGTTVDVCALDQRRPGSVATLNDALLSKHPDPA